MAKKDMIDITPVDEEQLNDADLDLDEEDFEEEEDEMTEKHPIKNFVSKHKKGLIAVGLTVTGFVLGCVAGSKTKKDSTNSDSSDEPLEIDCAEQQSQESETIESQATEVE